MDPFSQQHVTLMFEAYEESFHVRFITNSGEVLSHNVFALADEPEQLLKALPNMVAPFYGIVYLQEFNLIWNCQVGSEQLQLFLKAEGPSRLDTFRALKYSLEKFPAFLRANYELVKRRDNGVVLSSDDLPF